MVAIVRKRDKYCCPDSQLRFYFWQFEICLQLIKLKSLIYWHCIKSFEQIWINIWRLHSIVSNNNERTLYLLHTFITIKVISRKGNFCCALTLFGTRNTCFWKLNRFDWIYQISWNYLYSIWCLIHLQQPQYKWNKWCIWFTEDEKLKSHWIIRDPVKCECNT